MNPRPQLRFLGLVAAIVLAPLAANAKLMRTGSPSVSFKAVGPGGLKIVGSTADLNVIDDGTAVTIIIPLANLATGISLRDKHMREKYLQVAQFPNAELAVRRSALKVPAAGGESAGDAQGTVKLHGKGKAVNFRYTAKNAGGGYNVSGTIRINLNDFGIEVPSYLGVTVKPDVDVSVSFQAKE